MADQDNHSMIEGKPSVMIFADAESAKAYQGYAKNMELTEEHQTPGLERLTTDADAVSLSLTYSNDPGYFSKYVDFEDFYETQHYTLICRISDKFYEAIKSIMDHKTVGVAFEGENLGREGTLSLVQIATDSEVIIFDMIRLGSQAFEAGLKAVFESEDIIKVIHDCRWVAELLRHQHGVWMANVFDTQVANAFVHRNVSGGEWPNHVESLHNCLKHYLNLPPQADLSQIREHLSEANKEVWLVRPLSFELLDAATDSVIHLLRLQRVLLAEMLVEFKAAVDIYLNYSSEMADDMKTHRASRHLLPIAITYIDTYLKGNSSSCNIIGQQTASMAGNQDSSKIQASRRKKSSPRKLTQQSSQKGFYYKFSENAFSDEDTSSSPERENMDKGVLEYSTDVSKGEELVCNLKVLHGTKSLKEVKGNKRKRTGRNISQKRSSSSRKSAFKARLPPKRFQCDECERRFPSASALASHKPTHSDDRLFKCDVCEKTFKTYSTLYGHKLIHSGQRPHMCDICGKCFLVKTALRKHLISHSDERSSYKCDICDKSYINLRGLRVHKEIHTGQRPYKCDVCPKSFTSSSFLIQHKKIHTGLKPFKCSVCEKTFVRSYHLKVHYEKIHCGYKPYRCEICYKSFVVNADLSQHKKLHVEQKL